MKFVCFSSGSQPRYRDDIIRAMAMPEGAELTFRYRLKYMGNSVQDAIKKGRIKRGDDVLISYVDQSDKKEATGFIPVRFATVLEVPEVGDFVALRMRVGRFAYAKDLGVFNQELRSQSGEVPEWKDATTQYPSGKHWIEVENYPKSVLSTTSDSDWQSTVGQLVSRTDFKDTGPFYRMSGVRRAGTDELIAIVDGQLPLRRGGYYEMLVDHYIPNPDPGRFQLEVQLTGHAVELVSGPKLQVDSPYNRHWVTFHTLEPLRDEAVVFTVLKKTTGPDPVVEFNLTSIVGGNRVKPTLLGILVGALLAAPQVVTLISNPAFATLTNSRLGWLIGITIFLNLFAGVIAAFNFRKPL